MGWQILQRAVFEIVFRVNEVIVFLKVFFAVFPEILKI